MSKRVVLWAWLSWVAVLYATLMPFEFGNQSFAQAWSHFTSLSFPQMSASARQQWVANILMFLPLGLFWAAWLSGYVRGFLGHLLVGLFVALLALATTAMVEFLQFWLPRREPSLLDMSGNFIGGVLGVLAWYGLSGPGRRWLAMLRQGGLGALRRGLVLYVVAYVLFAWLPLDFMVSWQEWAGKLDSDSWGLWRAPVGEDLGIRWWVLRSMIVVMTLPMGVLLGWWLVERVPAVSAFGVILLALVPGVAFGLLVEFGQFLTVSGVAEGGSALSRALGVTLGVVLYVGRAYFTPHRMRFWARPAVLLLFIPYLLLMVVLNLGGKGFALETGSVLAKLESVRFLPFWYHYMVPEAVAIGSLLLHVVMYVPVGIGVWLWRWGPGGITPRRGLWLAVLLAFMLALVMETGKLYMAGLRPDPTSVWIAAAAGWLGWQACAAAWWGLRGVRDWGGWEKAHPGRPAVREKGSRQRLADSGSEYPGVEPADAGFVRGEALGRGGAPRRQG
ncbi:VanZ family protein [Ectothiorhodospira sp. BSL-9]|uniref:VanZ family protein n=1 Tax=Ectothiorhodospira sp. BSL-9 TaxID=1442136 RepID=UPI0009EE37FB|nr:VanZ family protein [Ectothiorhodospira sp. BSL-9]